MKEAKIKKKEIEPLPTICPHCNGTSFYIDDTKDKIICIKCGKEI